MMGEQETAPTSEAQDGGAPAESTPEWQAILSELGVQVDENGKISGADHAALYATVKTLREQAKTYEAAQRKAAEDAEKARLESMGEAERAIEEARQEGYQKALAEQREVVVRTQVTAAATAANFADPADAATMLGDLTALADEAAVRKAVEKLAADKPYLLRPAASAPPLEQGPRGGAKTADGGDWLQSALRKKRGA